MLPMTPSTLTPPLAAAPVLLLLLGLGLGFGRGSGLVKMDMLVVVHRGRMYLRLLLRAFLRVRGLCDLVYKVYGNDENDHGAHCESNTQSGLAAFV